MKSNFIHICFIIDESGSMSSSTSDVVGGFNKMINEQKAEKDGTCAISLYKFNQDVSEIYIGKDVNEVKELKSGRSFNIDKILGRRSNKPLTFYDPDLVPDLTESLNKVDEAATYNPNGCTAMNDGIGTAIDKIGQWLANMPEEERPEKNLIVIMTDGEENSSREYTLEKVKEMIKHQEEKYSWTFMYMGTDIKDVKDAVDLGISHRSYHTRHNLGNSYAMVSKSVSSYRKFADNLDATTKSAMLNKELTASELDMNLEYEQETGLKMS